MAFEKNTGRGVSVRKIVRELHLSPELYTDAQLRAEVERRVGHPVKPSTISQYKSQLRSSESKGTALGQPLSPEVAESAVAYPAQAPTEFSIAEARRHLAEICARAEYARTQMTVTKRGRPIAAIVGISDLKRWKALEDRHIVEVFERALATSRGIEKADLAWLRRMAGPESDEPGGKPAS
ncbi:MAG: type II toxin-antitoxin system Phd/YefM family antitoxin [Armatimonadota bacterium]